MTWGSGGNAGAENALELGGGRGLTCGSSHQLVALGNSLMLSLGLAQMYKGVNNTSSQRLFLETDIIVFSKE